MIYELYGLLHKNAKRVLKRNNELPSNVKLVSFNEADFNSDGTCNLETETKIFINEKDVSGTQIQLKKSDVYPVENLAPINLDAKFPLSFNNQKCSFIFSKTSEQAIEAWAKFIDNSRIPEGFRNGGCHYAGYIKECSQWCLPSWIWTNAALVRYYCLNNEIDKAIELGKLIIDQQQDCGGWIVRNDYSKDGIIPELAPNDSCYIALNCCLALYDATGNEFYLESAEKNAAWIIETARPDGLVYFAFDAKRNHWIKDRNIVDTGFTAGLFARLYEITEKKEYLQFLEQFITVYIKVFFMPEHKCFATAIDGHDNQHGGAFGRGQGWALEGLIPAYRVLKKKELKQVIDDTVRTLLRMQLKDGGWSYNLLKPLMGVDCKAVPVIAKCLVDWYQTGEEDTELLQAAKLALKWCEKHTVISGEAYGGIFSYTIEGAIVHHMYTNTAFVYGSSYAAEVKILLDKVGK